MHTKKILTIVETETIKHTYSWSQLVHNLQVYILQIFEMKLY